MKIAVCIKQVVTREWQLRVNEGKTWIRDQDASFELNEPDAYALEEALRLKEKHGGEGGVGCAGAARASRGGAGRAAAARWWAAPRGARARRGCPGRRSRAAPIARSTSSPTAWRPP